jgi:hypothetical protein
MSTYNEADLSPLAQEMLESVKSKNIMDGLGSLGVDGDQLPDARVTRVSNVSDNGIDRVQHLELALTNNSKFEIIIDDNAYSIHLHLTADDKTLTVINIPWQQIKKLTRAIEDLTIHPYGPRRNTYTTAISKPKASSISNNQINTNDKILTEITDFLNELKPGDSNAAIN